MVPALPIGLILNLFCLFDGHRGCCFLRSCVTDSRPNPQPDDMEVMSATQPWALDRRVSRLPGWLFLVGGLALIALALLTPAWVDCCQLRWQRDMLGDRVEGWANVKQRCQQYHEALQSDDPVLIECLAFDHLRFKPVGSTVLTDETRTDEDWTASSPPVGEFAPDAQSIWERRTEIDMPETIEPRWIWAEPPIYIERHQPRLSGSILVRLTSSKSQALVVGLGVVCLVSGLTWSPSQGRKEPSRG